MADKLVLECSLHPSRVTFLLGPTQFYDKLCSMYRNANRRIVLASLYVGSGKLERELIESIIEAKKRNQDLTVDVLVDKTRTTRISKNGGIETPLSLLQPFLVPGNQVKVALFHNPLYGRFCSKVIKNPYCEAFGTMHLKVYIGDDECIITGANTAKDYFCDRYDRYMLVKDALFSDAMHTFIKMFQTASYTFTENLTVEWLSDFMNPMEDNMLFRKQLYIRTREMVNHCHEVLLKRLKKKRKGDGFKRAVEDALHAKVDHVCKGYSKEAIAMGDDSDPSIADDGYLNQVPKELSGVEKGAKQCNGKYHKSRYGDNTESHRLITDDIPSSGNPEDEYVNIKICLQVPFSEPPFVQGGNLLDDYVLNCVNNDYSVFIATAYMNFTDSFMAVLNKALNIARGKGRITPLQVVTSSPYANSFYDGSWKRYIALFYSKAASWLLSALKHKGKYPDDVYMEYNRPNHTFHAKGMWAVNKRVSLDAAHESEEKFLQETELPYSTVIGSSNYGRRSCNKDLEVIFFVETNSKKLGAFMRQEIYEVAKHSDYVSHDVVINRTGNIHLMACHALKEFM